MGRGGLGKGLGCWGGEKRFKGENREEMDETGANPDNCGVPCHQRKTRGGPQAKKLLSVQTGSSLEEGIYPSTANALEGGGDLSFRENATAAQNFE